MTKEELEKQFPELAAQLRAEGADAEHVRVVTHLKLGRMAGSNLGVPRSLQAIEQRQAVADVTSDYLEAQFRQNAINARQEDSDAVDAALAGVAPPRAKDGAGALADEVERQRNAGPGRMSL